MVLVEESCESVQTRGTVWLHIKKKILTSLKVWGCIRNTFWVLERRFEIMDNKSSSIMQPSKVSSFSKCEIVALWIMVVSSVKSLGLSDSNNLVIACLLFTLTLTLKYEVFLSLSIIDFSSSLSFKKSSSWVCSLWCSKMSLLYSMLHSSVQGSWRKVYYLMSMSSMSLMWCWMLPKTLWFHHLS